MRIERIVIDGFGHYRDRQFGPLAPGVAVICGPNGSGKSTIHQFVQTILFGFPRRNSSDWMPALYGGRLGGRVILTSEDGQPIIVERYADDRDAVVTLPDGELAGDATLRTLLGGATADVFSSIFAFGLDELWSLEGLPEGEVSSRIYGAGLGAEKLPQALETFDSSALEIFRPNGRVQPVAKALASLSDVERDLEIVRADAGEYHALRDERDGIDGNLAALDAHLNDLRDRHRRVTGWVTERDRRQRTLAEAESALGAGGIGNGSLAKDVPIADIAAARQATLRFQTRLNEAGWREREAEQDIESHRQELTEAERRFRALAARLSEMPKGVGDVAAHQRALDDLRESWARLETIRRMSPTSRPGPARASGSVPVAAYALLVAAVAVAVAGIALGGPLALGGVLVAALLVGLAVIQISQAGARPVARVPLSTADEVRRAERAFVEAAGAAGVSPAAGHDAITEAERLLVRSREVESVHEQHRQATAVVASLQASLSAELQHRHEAHAARDALASEWRVWLSARELSPDLSPDGALHLLDELDASRNLRDQARDARAALDELAAEIADAFGSPQTEESLREEAARLAAVMQTADEQRNELHVRRGELDERLRGLAGDTTGAELRARRAELITGLQADSREWAALTLASVVLQRARRRYEEERQPAVVQAAGDIFHWITGGAYERIFFPVDGRGEVTVITAGGERREVRELSRGTREQLYLAIRFGLIREFGKRACPLPVLVDDILVNFDPFRATAAVDALGALSTHHQIIVFTCHEDTADLIRTRIPGSDILHLEPAHQPSPR